MVILAAILIGVAAMLIWTLLTPSKEIDRMCNVCEECGEPGGVDLDTGTCYCVDCYASCMALTEEDQ